MYHSVSPLPRAPGALLLLLVLAATMPTPAVGSCDQIDPLDVLPYDEACPGWVRDGEPMTAYSYEELMQIINGAAGLYEQYGFVAAAFQNYVGEVAGEPAVATLSAFNQGTAENAEALYHDPEFDPGEPVADWPGSGEARVVPYLLSVTFQFWEECFFISINMSPGEDAGIQEARCLAEVVLTLIQGSVPARTETWGNIKASFQ